MLAITCSCPCGCWNPPITPKESPHLVAAGRHARDYRMVGPLVRGQGIRVLGVQREESAPIVQRNPRTRHHQPCPEALVKAVDERAGVPVPINHRQVGRIGSRIHVFRDAGAG